MNSDEPQEQTIRRRLFIPAEGARPFFAISFITIALILGSMAWYGLRYADLSAQKRVIEALQSGEARSVDAMAKQVEETLYNIAADLVLVRQLLERQLDGNFEKEALGIVLTDFIRSHRVYDQIRFIDNDGREVIRVNKTLSGAELVDESGLQDKSDSSYIRAAHDLDRNGLFITPMEPNREFGEIQLPIKPVTRVLVPVYAGAKRAGLAIINYEAIHLLRSLRSIGMAATGDPITINARGRSALDEFMSGAEDEISFDAPASISLPEEFPEIWSTMRKSDADSLQAPELGLLSYVQFRPETVTESSNFRAELTWHTPTRGEAGATDAWILGSRIPPERLEAITSIARTRSVTVELLFAALIFLLAWILALRISGLRFLARTLHTLAIRDHLTGLLSRGEFTRRMEDVVTHARRYSRSMAMLYVDLDEFKKINDTLGHAVGDKLLQHAASVLSRCTRQADIVGRLGGDEFAVALCETRSTEDTLSVVNYLKHQLSVPVDIDGHRLSVSASIGAATYPADGTDLESLTAHADQAMYEDKQKNLHARIASTESGAERRRGIAL